MSKAYQFEGVVTALSSISHNGGQSLGITAKLRREKFVLLDGTAEEIPVISGNGLRGMLRDRGMLHMCKTLGYGVDEETGEVWGLTLPAFYFLFSGGTLTSEGGKAIDIDRARELRGLIPLVGVFGGAVGNMILPGKVSIGKMIPICAETAHLLPQRFVPENPQSIWEYLQEEMYTRKDDEKNEHLRAVLEPGEAPKQLSGKTDKRDPEESTGQHQQMMYYVETFAAGTPFYWRIVLDDVSDVEFEAFLTALVEWSKRPHIGGKSNVGLGHVSVKFDRWLEIDSRTNVKGTEIDVPLGKKYQSHLRDNAEGIRSCLARMQ
jgi:CRISPR type IV-associated protein Csf2